MKKTVTICLVLVMLLCAAPPACAEDGYSLIVATDLHYIAPALTDHGSYFTALTEGGDGKLMRYIEEITDAFLDEAAAQKPEAVLLTGDLTFNGALLSHAALAEKLRALEAAGTRVLVLPGNHDLENPSAASFSGDGYTHVPSATAADFRQIYADFGYDEALSLDTDSLSYVVELGDGTRLLMLDFNTPHDPCGVSDKTLKWIEDQLADAKRAGQRILAAGHQNLFQQSMFRDGYVIQNAERLAALFREYGVPLYLSGHLHIQHWKTEQGLTEIATSALSVSPCQYGILDMRGDKLRYETKATDVTEWAIGQGSENPDLIGFRAYASDCFDTRNRQQTPEALGWLAYTEDEIARMTAYIVELNRAYFAGDLRAAAALDESGELEALFARFPSLYTVYLVSIRPDFGSDFRKWTN